MEKQYYDGTKLLNMQDLNKRKPEIYLCTTNRTGGKTTYFSRYLVNRFKKYNEKFMLLYRFSYELENVADKFFKDIQTLFFKEDMMEAKKKMKGVYYDLFLSGRHCGYAVDLNHSEAVKKNSHLFSDTESMFLDEFQSESNSYVPDEITKFISIHTSVARGQGKHVRRVPVYMCGNTVTLLNPYYAALGISNRLRPDTNFLRGDGYVLEQGYIETAARDALDSAFNRAFKQHDYIAYSAQNKYLNDNKTFIEKVSGKGKYTCTLKFKNKLFGIREFWEQGIVYCDTNPDIYFPVRLSVTLDDMDVNYLMLKRLDSFISLMRCFFDKGCFRFQNLECKEAVFAALSYR